MRLRGSGFARHSSSGKPPVNGQPSLSGATSHTTAQGYPRRANAGCPTGPIENVPGVCLSAILSYDFGREVGIHSLPMDKYGQVLDATLGQPASGGCVRVGEAAAVFEFAQMGTWVWVHQQVSTGRDTPSPRYLSTEDFVMLATVVARWSDSRALWWR